MTPVYFQLSDEQTTLLKNLMEKEGYKSKAEFFRFLLKMHEYRKQQLDAEMERVTGSLDKILTEMVKRDMIDPRPLSEQMKDLDHEDELENSDEPNHL